MAGKNKRSSPPLLLWAFLIILIVFGGLLARKSLMVKPPPELPPPVAEQPLQLREVILYFGSPEQSQLAAEAREIPGCREETECVQGLLQALVDGPVGELVPIIPSHAVLRAVTVTGGTVEVDFSREFIAAHPGGSQSELLTVYGLANTVAANFPHLRQVRILIEGEAAPTIKGHVDLRQPIEADFRLARPPEGEPAGGAEPGAEARSNR